MSVYTQVDLQKVRIHWILLGIFQVMNSSVIFVYIQLYTLIFYNIVVAAFLLEFTEVQITSSKSTAIS